MSAAQPPSKRQLRPAASLPTTAEIQAEKHGIDPAIAAALQSVGRKGRASIQLGKSQHSNPLGPTQSLPTIPRPETGFQTASDTIDQAQKIINKEIWKQREVQPFANSQTVNSLSLSPRGQKSRQEKERQRRLLFAPGGEWGVEVEETNDEDGMDWEPSPLKPSRPVLGKATKRDRNAKEEDGTETETDTDTEDIEHPLPGLTIGNSGSTINDDFPPVFTSPALSHPELFQSTSSTKGSGAGVGAMTGGKQLVNPALTRVTKGLPGGGRRSLGKTMSAPVGSLGLGGKWGGGDIEMDDGGFDVKEWAAQEDF